MRVSYSPGYHVPLPEGHPFPMGKFPALYDILRDEGLIRERDVVEPDRASWNDLLLVHTPRYLAQLERGRLGRRAERRMGLPWSRGLVRRSRLAVQGTIEAARMALRDGAAANLAGGTHHAFPDRGEGFCVLNDVAVAARALRLSGRVDRILVVDLDVHQGNGTASALQEEPGVTTYSLHAERNYPWRKVPSSRDTGLPDRTADDRYLRVLGSELPGLVESARPELVFYLAGVDPVAGDRYGRLSLTRDGLRRRDRLVLGTLRDRGVPVTLLLSGGYAATPEATADLHAEAHRAAAEIFGRRPGRRDGRGESRGESISRDGPGGTECTKTENGGTHSPAGPEPSTSRRASTT